MTIKKSKLSVALGGALVASMAASSVAVAAQNPFAMASLEKGYMVAEADTANAGKMKDGKCGEGKCGAAKSKAKQEAPKAKEAEAGKMKDGNCGANKDKMKDGACGGNKK